MGPTSLLRRSTVCCVGRRWREIAACMRAGPWRFCVLAPAFPYQGRITRAGRQYRNNSSGWIPVGDDLAAGLRAFGVSARRGLGDADLLPGITVLDAETDEDLRRIVATGRRCSGPVLWAGTGGLAQALTAGYISAGTNAAALADPGAVRIRPARDRRPTRRLRAALAAYRRPRLRSHSPAAGRGGTGACQLRSSARYASRLGGGADRHRDHAADRSGRAARNGCSGRW